MIFHPQSILDNPHLPTSPLPFLTPLSVYCPSYFYRSLLLSSLFLIHYNKMAFYGYGYQQPQQQYVPDMSVIIEPTNGKGGLYLGNIKAASDMSLLKKYRIGAVLTAAIEANVHYDHSIVPYHMIVQGHDVQEFDLENYFDQASKFIYDSLQVTNTLVHCMAGISRSTTLLIAYLVRYRGMKSDDALNYCRSRRSIINPNPGFWNQMKAYEKILNYKKKARGSGALVNQINNYNPPPTNNNHNQNYQGYGQNTGGQGYVYNQPAYDPFGFF